MYLYSGQPFIKWRDFEGSNNSRCGEILRKYSSYIQFEQASVPTVFGFGLLYGHKCLFVWSSETINSKLTVHAMLNTYVCIHD